MTPPPTTADQTTQAGTPNELIALASGERHVSRQRNSPNGSGQEVGIAGKATADTDAGAAGARPATSTDLGCDITAIVVAPRRVAQAGERPHNRDVVGARRWIKRALLGVLALGATVGCAGRPLSKPDGSTGASGVGGVLGAAGGEAAGTQGLDTCSADADCPPIECAIAPCSRAICALGDDGFHHCTAHLPVGSCQPDDPSCCAGDVNCPSGQSCLAGSPRSFRVAEALGEVAIPALATFASPTLIAWRQPTLRAPIVIHAFAPPAPAEATRTAHEVPAVRAFSGSSRSSRRPGPASLQACSVATRTTPAVPVPTVLAIRTRWRVCQTGSRVQAASTVLIRESRWAFERVGDWSSP